MIVKILRSSATFAGVRYSTDKMQTGKGELIFSRGFGPLEALSEIKPSDYINYFKIVSALNSRISKPQFHAVISTKGNLHSKEYLADLGVKWMEKMGYGNNPYLIIFHRDTANNHIHLVSTRIDKQGKKISSAFEKVRAVKLIHALEGEDIDLKAKKDLEIALGFSFSTLAQFRLILETRGYALAENSGKIKLIKYGRVLQEVEADVVLAKVLSHVSHDKRLQQLHGIFQKYKSLWDTSLSTTPSAVSKFKSPFTENLMLKFGIEIIFHARNNLPPYGYSVIDHRGGNVFKGSQIAKISEIINGCLKIEVPDEDQLIMGIGQSLKITNNLNPFSMGHSADYQRPSVKSPLSLAEDIDDEAIHGRNRQRKGKARTNTR